VSPYSFALVAAGLGDRDEWRRQMHASLEERCGLLALLRAPWHDDVKSDPYFEELIRQVGLPPEER